MGETLCSSVVECTFVEGLPWCCSSKEPACQSRRSLVRKDLLEKEMATHSSIPAWEIPCTEIKVKCSPSPSLETPAKTLHVLMP